MEDEPRRSIGLSGKSSAIKAAENRAPRDLPDSKLLPAKRSTQLACKACLDVLAVLADQGTDLGPRQVASDNEVLNEKRDLDSER